MPGGTVVCPNLKVEKGTLVSSGVYWIRSKATSKDDDDKYFWPRSHFVATFLGKKKNPKKVTFKSKFLNFDLFHNRFETQRTRRSDTVHIVTIN